MVATSLLIGVELPDGDQDLDWALARDTLIEASRVSGASVAALRRGSLNQSWLPPGCEVIDASGDPESSLAMLSDRAEIVVLLNPVFAPISTGDIQAAVMRLENSSLSKLSGAAGGGEWWMIAAQRSGTGAAELPRRERASRAQLRDLLMHADAPLMPATRRALHVAGEMPDSAPWRVIERKDEIVTPWRTAVRERVRTHSGDVIDYRYTRAADPVVVVPVTRDGDIVLIRQWRQPIGDWSLEVPAGTGEGTFAEMARMELAEEIGMIDLDELRWIGSWHPLSGHTNIEAQTFVALGVTLGEQQLERNELVVPEMVPFEIAVDLARRGEINDGMCALAVLAAEPAIRAWLASQNESSGDPG